MSAVEVWTRLKRHHLGTWLAGVVGLAGIAALILVINPAKLGSALTHFNLVLLPAIVAGSVGYYVLQGVRWQFLLRDVGAKLPMGETVLLNLAGQVTTLLPLGELTRVVLAARAARVPFSDALATVTVQELIYGLLLVVVAVPGLFEFHLNPLIPAAALLVAMLALAVMTVPPIFCGLHSLMSRILGLRRLLDPLDELQAGTAGLLHRLDTIVWSLISLVQVAAMTTVFFLVVTALDPGALTWPEAASLYAVASIAGAVSLIPGGLGASEATFAGLLIVVGLPPAEATAVALMQRMADQGVATVAGLIAFVIVRRRYHIGSLFTLQPGRSRNREGSTEHGLAATEGS
ncbi:MAG TPA: lysylphosphatidylglycerol synthase transmembrane domain-containing protein [Candidatus Nanopelagicaceae bacterium]|nr:lysylphosphatidylglycerol synthase transmembrane domain-containing protein [Candidatus Nanopelagicaceae bacterium]